MPPRLPPVYRSAFMRVRLALLGNPTHPTPGRSAAERAVDLAEGGAGAGAERGHDRDAGHEDQGQHDRVLNRRRTVFADQELTNLLDELHGSLLSFGDRLAAIWVGRFHQSLVIPSDVAMP